MNCIRRKHFMFTVPLLNSTKFTHGKLQYPHFLEFNNHTKSLCLLCSFGSQPENLQFCCHCFCQNADRDKMDLQKKGVSCFFPLTFTVFFLIKNCTVYLYHSLHTKTHSTMYCILTAKYADLHAKILQD